MSTNVRKYINLENKLQNIQNIQPNEYSESEDKVTEELKELWRSLTIQEKLRVIGEHIKGRKYEKIL